MLLCVLVGSLVMNLMSIIFQELFGDTVLVGEWVLKKLTTLFPFECLALPVTLASDRHDCVPVYSVGTFASVYERSGRCPVPRMAGSDVIVFERAWGMSGGRRERDRLVAASCRKCSRRCKSLLGNCD